jgi:hypothetical protein
MKKHTIIMTLLLMSGAVGTTHTMEHPNRQKTEKQEEVDESLSIEDMFPDEPLNTVITVPYSPLANNYLKHNPEIQDEGGALFLYAVETNDRTAVDKYLKDPTFVQNKLYTFQAALNIAKKKRYHEIAGQIEHVYNERLTRLVNAPRKTKK